MCQDGLKIGRVQGQQAGQRSSRSVGVRRRIPRPVPKAVPRLEADCEVLRRGGETRGSGWF